MALTQISDVIVPEDWDSYKSEMSVDSSAFVQSGIMVRDPLLDQFATSGGRQANLPFWTPLDHDDEALISNDNPADIATPSKISAGKMVAQTAYINKPYQAADLASELAGANAMDAIKDKMEGYFTGQVERRLIASVEGIGADSAVSHGEDMINDISIEDGDNATADNLFSRAAFTKAMFTMGDAFKKLSGTAMHSTVYNRVADNDDIAYIPDSQGVLTSTYMGKTVIVDDNITVEAGLTSGFKFNTYIFGQGAFGYGEGTPLNPVEVERSALGGNGGGIETLVTRKQMIIHPFGYQFTAASMAGESPTIAELKLPANWTRVFSRKNVPVAILVTNG